MSSITEAAGGAFHAGSGGRLQAMTKWVHDLGLGLGPIPTREVSREEFEKMYPKEVKETVNVSMPVDPLAYCKITGLTVPEHKEEIIAATAKAMIDNAKADAKAREDVLKFYNDEIKKHDEAKDSEAS